MNSIMNSARHLYRLLLTCLLGLVPSWLNAQGPVPKIHVDEMLHDFGRVRSGAVIQHEFTLTNRGNADLLIHGVLPSCGCTTVTDFPSKVAPGGTAKLSLSFNSTSLMGEQIRTLMVKNNDPERPDLILQLKGNYWMPIEIYPLTALMFLPPQTDQKLSTTIRVVNRLEKPLKLQAPVSSVPQLTARLVEHTPGKEFHIVVDTVPPFAHKDIQATIKVATDSPETPSIDIKVVVIAQPELTVSPQQMLLPVDLPAHPKPYVINIRNSSQDNIKLEKPTCDAPGSRVEIRETTPGKDFELVVHFSQEMTKDPEKTFSIMVNTSLPTQPQILIPVQFLRPALATPQPHAP